MARFAVGDRVITPKHGEGEIVLVWPRKDIGKTTYNVSVSGHRLTLVYNERDLTAAAHVPEGANVRCEDCSNARPSNYIRGMIHCGVLARVKSPAVLRICPSYAAKPIRSAIDYYANKDHRQED